MNDGQGRGWSLIEAAANVLGGYLLGVASNLVILPWWGFAPDPAQAFEIGAAFAVPSLCRSYLFRRIFERIRRKRKARACQV